MFHVLSIVLQVSNVSTDLVDFFATKARDSVPGKTPAGWDRSDNPSTGMRKTHESAVEFEQSDGALDRIGTAVLAGETEMTQGMDQGYSPMAGSKDVISQSAAEPSPEHTYVPSLDITKEMYESAALSKSGPHSSTLPQLDDDIESCDGKPVQQPAGQAKNSNDEETANQSGQPGSVGRGEAAGAGHADDDQHHGDIDRVPDGASAPQLASDTEAQAEPLSCFELTEYGMVKVTRASTTEDFEVAASMEAGFTAMAAVTGIAVYIARLIMPDSSAADAGTPVGCLMATFGTNVVRERIFEFETRKTTSGQAPEGQVEVWGIQVNSTSLPPCFRTAFAMSWQLY